jgi:hypothetical protein
LRRRASRSLSTTARGWNRQPGLNAPGEFGYTEDDIPTLVDGAMKQQRLLTIAPKEVGDDDQICDVYWPEMTPEQACVPAMSLWCATSLSCRSPDTSGGLRTEMDLDA